MSEKLNSKIAVIGIDIGKNSFHIVGQDRRGALVLRQKWSRGQVEARLANQAHSPHLAFLCETGCYETFAGDGSFVRGVCCCKRWLQAARAMHVLTACFRCKCYARPFGRTD